ncbi:MAG: hypothetical protein MI867_03770 [Pseudomonadales bacterium]|nr:hypothetical protein [Pseudomonadales bacterium]
MSRIAMVLVLVCCSAWASAAPTLNFDGSFSFVSSTGKLTIDAVITGSEDLSTPITTSGSTFSLVSLFEGVGVNGPMIESQFGGSGASNDFAFTNGGDLMTLLSGDVGALTMAGFAGSNFGFLSGNLEATAGELLSDFYTEASLFALELNLTSDFSIEMFTTDFSGRVDGNLRGVPGEVPIPEPGVLVLFVLAFLGFRIFRKI